MSALIISQSPRASSASSNNTLQSQNSPLLNNFQGTFDEQPNNCNSPSKQDVASSTSSETSGSNLSGSSTGEIAEDEEDAETDNTSSQVVTLPITPVRIVKEDSLAESHPGDQDTDDIFDLDFDKELMSDSDVDESPDAELDIAEDDDDYDAIDRLSDTSEHSAHMEGDAEDDILAEAELDIDWNDEQTYGFVDSWENSQYSLAAELQLGDSLPEDTLLLLDQARRMSASSRPPVEKPVVATYVGSISFPDEWSSSDDEEGSNDEKPIIPDDDLIRCESHDTSICAQTNTDSLSGMNTSQSLSCL